MLLRAGFFPLLVQSLVGSAVLVCAQDAAAAAPVVELGYATYAGSYVGETTHFVGMRYAAPPIGTRT